MCARSKSGQFKGHVQDHWCVSPKHPHRIELPTPTYCHPVVAMPGYGDPTHTIGKKSTFCFPRDRDNQMCELVGV